MMTDSQFDQLQQMPAFWRGRAAMRLILADECRGDPVMERHHAAVAAQYEAEAQRLGRYRP